MLWLRTLIFALIVPGTVLVLIPVGPLAAGIGPTMDLGPFRWVGFLPVGLG